MSENTAEKYHKPYAEVVLEAQHNRDLFLREVDLHNKTIADNYKRELNLQIQIEELERKIQKGNQALVLHYEQQIRNLDGLEELVKVLQSKKTVDK
jgi:hypothetical protein